MNPARRETAPPRIGFLGVGRIGRHRMEAMLAEGRVRAVGIADPAAEAVEAAARLAPEALRVATLDELLEMGLDGVVIATPSALHAQQSIAALGRGAAVFCQKPLGRDLSEVLAVIESARATDRLLGVDLSYRFTDGMRLIRRLVRAGDLGRVQAVDLMFHNAYGPDKAWFYDPALSGGGCVADLGVHLVDLALWVLDFPDVSRVTSSLLSGGAPLANRRDVVEDYAVATLDLACGAIVRLACSWRLPAGRDALIRATFHGLDGGAEMRNVDGSFHDFVAERFFDRRREPLPVGSDAWGGRAAAHWAERLRSGVRFDPDIERMADVAAVLDRIYQDGRDPWMAAGPRSSRDSGPLPERAP